MHRFITQTYELTTHKISRPLTFAIVSDLHGCPYGERQRELLAAIAGERPDAVLMAGDMNDERGDEAPFWDFLRGVAGIAPCCYVTGNHDYGRHSSCVSAVSRREAEDHKAAVSAAGIRVLSGEKELLPGADGTVAVMGLDDVFVGQEEWDRQYLNCCRLTDPKQYTILVSHRPELVGAYRYFPGDLVVCGHAHGGQWRLPGARGGVYAPGQGLFPRYAGGLYERRQGYLLVSCGLCYRYPPIPRFGNPPELVILRLRPEE